MKRRILSLLLALCMIVGLLPSVAMPHAHAAVTTATVTLFGTAVTVDLDETTADIPEAYYWVNGEEGALPVAATAEDDWNYSFAIIDDIPTVTIRNANYKHTATFLSAKYDGKLKLAYEGDNTFYVPYKASSGYAFVSYGGATNSAGKGHLYMEAAEGATLNVTGGSKNVTMLALSNKAYLTVTGGKINIERTNAGGVNGVLSAAYGKVALNKCELNLKDLTAVSGKHPLVTIGNGTSYGLTITDSNVTMESNAYITLCMGVFQSNMKGVLYSAFLTINGDSDVKIINKSNNTGSTYEYNGIGIWARTVTVSGGSLEAEGPVKAIHTTTGDAPSLSKYTGVYNMFTAKGDEAASEYTTTTYFKVAPCDHSAVEGVEEITKAPTCTEVGTKTLTCTCTYGHTWTETVEIPATGHTKGETVPDSSAGAFVTYCSVCGEVESSEPATKLDKAYTLKIFGTSYKLTHKDIPIYTVNTTKSGYFNTTKYLTDENGAYILNSKGEKQTVVDESFTKDYITQSTEGADESNYNAKLIWHSDDEAPTLYLRDFVLDNYNEEMSKWRYSAATSTSALVYAGMHTGSTAPLTIKVESGDCLLRAHAGLQYQNDLTIESADNATLTIWSQAVGICPSSMGSQYAGGDSLLSGYDLTLDANLLVSTQSYSSTTHSPALIRVVGGDLTINGGNISTEYNGPQKSVRSFNVEKSGNLYVNGGHISAASHNGNNLKEAAIHVADNAYITGGTLELRSYYQSGLLADNIYISGGEVKANVEHGGLVVRGEAGVVSITGGVTEIFSNTKRLFTQQIWNEAGDNCSQPNTKPVITAPEGLVAAIKAGADAAAATAVKDIANYGYDDKYMKLEFVEKPACDHSNTTTTETVITDATCTTAGSKQVTVTCECGEIISDDVVTIEAKGHTAAAPVEENKVDSDLNNKGSYDSVVYCSVCGAELSRETIEIPVKEGAVAEVDGTKYETLDEAIKAANAMTGEVTIDILGKAEYNDASPNLGSSTCTAIHFVGKAADAEFCLLRNGSNGYVGGNTAVAVTYTDLILSKPAGGSAYDAGFRNIGFCTFYVGSVSYTNCIFANGAVASGSETTYTGCTFKATHDRYGMFAYGDAAVTVEGCTFDALRGIKLWAEGMEKDTALTVKTTDFSKLTQKPAIVLTSGESVTLEGNTYSSTGTFELDLDGVPNGTPVTSTDPIICFNDNGACGVLVDGKIYTTVAQAAAAATEGSTVTLLHESAETVELPEGVTLDKNGFTAAGVTEYKPRAVEVKTLAELQAALADNSNDLPIVITETIVIAKGETVTIDLNGKTVKVPEATGKHIYALRNLGTLTLKDSKGTGSITARGIYNGADGSNTTAQMFVESGKYIAQDTDGGASIFNYAVLTINGGQFVGGLCSVNVRTNAVATINGGTFSGNSDSSYQIQNNGGHLTINYATVDSGFGAVGNYAGTTVINDGSFLPTGRPSATCHVVYVAGGADVTINGGTYKMNYPADGVPDSGSAVASYYGGTLAINGGDFTAHFDNVSPVELSNGSTIKGGTYKIHSGAVSNHSYVKNFLADGYELNPETGTVVLAKTYVAEVNGVKFESVAAALAYAKEAELTDVTITLLGEVTKAQAVALDDSFYLYGDKQFDSVTFKQEDASKVYHIMGLYTGSRTNGGKFIFDGVNIVVIDQYIFEGNVVLTNNSYVGSVAEANCFIYNGETTIEPGSVLKGVIEDFRSGDMIVDGGNNDGSYNTDPAVQDAIMHIRWSGDKLVLKNGAYVKINAVNEIGRLNLSAGTAVELYASKLDVWEYIDVAADAEIRMDLASLVTTKKITGSGKIVIDVTGFDGNAKQIIAADMSGFTGTVELVGGKAAYEITDTGLTIIKKGLEGSGTEADPYLITDLDELILFRDSVNAGETKYNAPGVYVALDADIDMAGIDWSVNIGDDCNATFDGIFDGKNHIIKNLTSTETKQKGDVYICTGLFGAIYGSAEIKNLTIENVTINVGEFTGNNVGAVVGFAYAATGAIENVTVCGDIKIDASGAYGVGAIVGYDYLGKLTIEDCAVIGNEGSYIKGTGAGGIIGYANAVTVSDCNVENIAIEGKGLIGGIAGLGLAQTVIKDSQVKNVALTTTGEYWVNSAAVAVGTIAANGTTVSNVTFENVTANGAATDKMVGSAYAEKPTAVVPAVQAKVGDKYYTTLEAAIAAGDEVTLVADVVLEDTLTIAADKTVVLNLNGYTISQEKACTGNYNMILNKGNLTITGNGKISFTDTGVGDASFGWGSYTIRNEGNLVVENGTIENLSNQNGAGSVKHMYCAIFQYCGSSTINGGTISTPTYRSVRLWKGDMTINGGNFEGQVWIQAVDSTAKMIIAGGTFAPRGVDGSSVFVGNIDSNGKLHSVDFKVTGGTFTTKIGANDVASLNGPITGGTFTADAMQKTNAGLINTEYEFVENEDGTYGVELHVHAEEIIPGKAATCTETGLTEGKKCSVCGEILVAQEEIAALGHTEETIPAVDATCGATGLTAGTKCSVCGEILVAQEEIPATGEHVFDNAGDTTCNNCDYTRVVEPTFIMDENNKLVVVDPNADHIYHRVVVYYLGDQTVEDITKASQLKLIDPSAKTYWGLDDINKVELLNTGNYVVHLHYNTAGSPKYTVAKEFTVVNKVAPTIKVENGKITVTDKNANNIYHRATVFYLGTETVSNIYDVNALKALDPTAKTTWDIEDINKLVFTKSGNYVIHLYYNTPGSSKMTVAEQFTVTMSKPTVKRDGYKLVVTDNDLTHTHHRATVYFIGESNVDIYDEAAVKALDPTAKTFWGLEKINQIQMARPGKYVVYLHYNLENGVKQTMVMKCTISMPVPEVWLEENGQIGTTIPVEVVHRNYVIYYLGDQTVEDIRDIDALKAIDPDPIKFDNQKQIAERGVLTEKGNYVLVVYYNYPNSTRQYIAEFATLK